MRVVEFITFPDISPEVPVENFPIEPKFAFKDFTVGTLFPWEEFIIQFDEEDRETVNNYRDAIIAERIKCTSYPHQYDANLKTCAVFEDGTIAYWGCRDWSAMMAAIWSYAENKRYGSHDFI